MAEQTVLGRLLRSGISESRALSHIRGGWVRVDGLTVTDPTFSVEPSSDVELRMIIRWPGSDNEETEQGDGPSSAGAPEQAAAVGG